MEWAACAPLDRHRRIEHRIEYCDPETVEAARVEAAVTRIGEVVLDPDDVEVIITGDLRATVEVWQPGYTPQRRLGWVDGKVIAKPGGGLAVVLPCWSFLSVAPEWSEGLHVATHEAFHVVLRQRDEDLDELAANFADDDLSASFALTAAQVLIEYRVERAAIESGFGPVEPWHVRLPLRLEEAQGLFGQVVQLRWQHEAEQRMFLQLRALFTELAHEIAWLSAAELAADEATPTQTSASWARLVDSHYASVRDVLASVPSALTPTPRDELEARAGELIPILRQWLRFIGVLTGADEHGSLTMGLARTDFQDARL